MNTPSSPAAEWTRRAERGNLPLLRFMTWASLAFGRTATRVLLRAVAAYFLVFGGAARRASRDFLARSLGRAPSLAEQYRVVFGFASTVHDRVYFLRERFELFAIEVRGTELFRDKRGVLLMGAHLGSFEALRACGRHLGHRRVAMAMHEHTTRRINAVLAAVNPAAVHDIVALGRADSMIELAQRLDEGALVGILADRTLGDEPALTIPFLGAPASFPTGPMRMAAALRRRVIFMAGLYRGGNRYAIRFEEIADFADLEGLSRAAREQRVNEGVAAYAATLERHAREAPFNWFNFHDFWMRAP
jgi:predicted LPLAT superfamily acyltransferase